MEWNRRTALEKELDRDETSFQHISICFDETSNFLIYPTPVGIKVSKGIIKEYFELKDSICLLRRNAFKTFVFFFQVLNLFTDKIVREIGKTENMRFLGVSLCQPVPDIKDRFQVFLMIFL